MESFDSIWAPHEAFYIQSMLFHTRQACASMEYISVLLNEINGCVEAGKVPEFDCSVALDHVQNVVLRAGALARYFWPVRKAHRSRGARLLAAFNVQDDSPLCNVELRHAAEHFDERLDKYLSNGIVGVILPEWFGPTHQGQAPIHYFRAFFIDSGLFRVLDQEIAMQPVADEIVRLHNLLVEYDQQGGRLPVGA